MASTTRPLVLAAGARVLKPEYAECSRHLDDYFSRRPPGLGIRERVTYLLQRKRYRHRSVPTSGAAPSASTIIGSETNGATPQSSHGMPWFGRRDEYLTSAMIRSRTAGQGRSISGYDVLEGTIQCFEGGRGEHVAHEQREQRRGRDVLGGRVRARHQRPRLTRLEPWAFPERVEETFQDQPLRTMAPCVGDCSTDCIFRTVPCAALCNLGSPGSNGLA